MKLVAVAGAVLFLLGVNAAAQNAAPVAPMPNHAATGAVQNGGPKRPPGADCMPDARRLCKNVVPGEGRIIACLHSHMKEVSPACRIVLPMLKPSGPIPPTLPHPAPGSTL